MHSQGRVVTTNLPILLLLMRLIARSSRPPPMSPSNPLPTRGARGPATRISPRRPSLCPPTDPHRPRITPLRRSKWQRLNHARRTDSLSKVATTTDTPRTASIRRRSQTHARANEKAHSARRMHDFLRIHRMATVRVVPLRSRSNWMLPPVRRGVLAVALLLSLRRIACRTRVRSGARPRSPAVDSLSRRVLAQRTRRRAGRRRWITAEAPLRSSRRCPSPSHWPLRRPHRRTPPSCSRNTARLSPPRRGRPLPRRLQQP